MGRVIRPTMEAIVQRLQEDGGHGAIWERDSEAMHRPRVILWMSVKGKISGPPRQDGNPYLQLDVDMAQRRIDVWEGDMWENSGVSRATAPWDLGTSPPRRSTGRSWGSSTGRRTTPGPPESSVRSVSVALCQHGLFRESLATEESPGPDCPRPP